jgi:hypothetical protein
VLSLGTDLRSLACLGETTPGKCIQAVKTGMQSSDGFNIEMKKTIPLMVV